MEQVVQIPTLNKEWIAQGLSLQDRAEAAWKVRHDARLAARAMMADPAEVALLRARDMTKYGNPDGPAFEFLMERGRAAGLDDDAIYQAIIDDSYRTDPAINKKLGL